MIDSRVTDPTLLHRARARDDGPGGVRGCLCADVVGTSRGGKTSQHAASQVTQRKPHRRAKMNVALTRSKNDDGSRRIAGTHDIAHARVARATRPAGRRAGRVAAARRRRVLVSGLSASSPRAHTRQAPGVLPACAHTRATDTRGTSMAAKPPKRWTPQYIKRTHTKHRVRYGVRVPKRPCAHLIRFRGCRRRHMCTNRAPLRRARGLTIRRRLTPSAATTPLKGHR